MGGKAYNNGKATPFLAGQSIVCGTRRLLCLSSSWMGGGAQQEKRQK